MGSLVHQVGHFGQNCLLNVNLEMYVTENESMYRFYRFQIHSEGSYQIFSFWSAPGPKTCPQLP